MSDSIRAVAPPGDQRFTLREWIPVSERVPGPEVGVVLAAFEMDGPGDWRMKCASYEPECRDLRYQGGWRIFGGSWTPTHWMPLPDPPRASDRYPQGQDPQRLGAEPAEPAPKDAPKTFQNRSEDAPPSEPTA